VITSRSSKFTLPSWRCRQVCGQQWLRDGCVSRATIFVFRFLATLTPIARFCRLIICSSLPLCSITWPTRSCKLHLWMGDLMSELLHAAQRHQDRAFGQQAHSGGGGLTSLACFLIPATHCSICAGEGRPNAIGVLRGATVPSSQSKVRIASSRCMARILCACAVRCEAVPTPCYTCTTSRSMY
jgi:hypothetical protein